MVAFLALVVGGTGILLARPGSCRHCRQTSIRRDGAAACIDGLGHGRGSMISDLGRPWYAGI
ncbi:hypothetical protein [Methylobacterium sp. WL9]|uniref:hypothetical protein n=1 Tax=Methylobacterium sp. WL9 TaxID=2603898 RepID=UPI001650341F|nr:hypothetical protein [Methylobacterium sp. WL9]